MNSVMAHREHHGVSIGVELQLGMYPLGRFRERRGPPLERVIWPHTPQSHYQTPHQLDMPGIDGIDLGRNTAWKGGLFGVVLRCQRRIKKGLVITWYTEQSYCKLKGSYPTQHDLIAVLVKINRPRRQPFITEDIDALDVR